MNRKEVIEMLVNATYSEEWQGNEKLTTAHLMAIEALKAQEFDEVVFDMNEFFSIVDDGKITVMRRGKGRVTVERQF